MAEGKSDVLLLLLAGGFLDLRGEGCSNACLCSLNAFVLVDWVVSSDCFNLRWGSTCS